MRGDGIVASSPFPPGRGGSKNLQAPSHIDSAAGFFICQQLPRDTARLFRPVA